MKQRELINKLKSIGFELERHGGNHDVYSKEVGIVKSLLS